MMQNTTLCDCPAGYKYENMDGYERVCTRKVSGCYCEHDGTKYLVSICNVTLKVIDQINISRVCLCQTQTLTLYVEETVIEVIERKLQTT